MSAKCDGSNEVAQGHARSCSAPKMLSLHALTVSLARMYSVKAALCAQWRKMLVMRQSCRMFHMIRSAHSMPAMLHLLSPPVNSSGGCCTSTLLLRRAQTNSELKQEISSVAHQVALRSICHPKSTRCACYQLWKWWQQGASCTAKPH